MAGANSKASSPARAVPAACPPGPSESLTCLRAAVRDPWLWAALAAAAPAVIPLLALLAAMAAPQPDIWTHLWETLLPEAAGNTAKLLLGVSAGTLLLGVPLGWLVACCEFPGRRIFGWALLLPLATPAYVTAFAWLGLLDVAGPVQTTLRDLFPGLKPVWVDPLAGSVLTLTLASYPYVYLLSRGGFAGQNANVLEAARSLGGGPLSAFIRVSLPLARPWIAGGLLLALMETLADFGAVSVFNFQTMTTAVYKAWFGFFSLPAATQLAGLLLVAAGGLAWAERVSRNRRRYASSRTSRPASRIRLAGARSVVATGFCLGVLAAGFLLPVAQLTVWALSDAGLTLDARLRAQALRSVALGLGAATLVCLCALALAYARRWWRADGLCLVATLGYAMPGTVLAVGVFLPAAWLDKHLSLGLEALFGIEPVSLLLGTPLVMLAAYAARFMATGFGAVDGGLGRVPSSLDDAARLLGASRGELVRRVHLPLVSRGLITAALLVFVDVAKEMPITLMTRPFGWDTLAVKIFEFTSEGDWARAALPALLLVLAGLPPVVLLNRQLTRREA